MEAKIPQTKQEAYAQLDEMLSEEEKSKLVIHWACGSGITGFMSKARRMLNVWLKPSGLRCCFVMQMACQRRSLNHTKDT